MKDKIIQGCIKHGEAFMIDNKIVLPTIYKTTNRTNYIESTRRGNITRNYTTGKYPTNRNIRSLKLEKENIHYEIPILIKDRELWKKLCPNYLWERLENGKIVTRDIQDTSVLYLDYTDGTHIIECDGKQHIENEGQRLLDKAKDSYIKIKYGLDVKRIYGFGYDIDSKFCKKAELDWKKEIGDFTEDNLEIFDESEEVIKIWKETYKDELHNIKTKLWPYVKENTLNFKKLGREELMIAKQYRIQKLLKDYLGIRLLGN